MDAKTRNERIAAGLVVAAAAFLLFAGIWSFGIWDPWELNAADVARRLAAGGAPTEDGSPLRVPPLTPWLVGRGFALFGVHEWAGRMPMAIAGLLAALAGMATAWRFAGARAGLYTAIVAVSSPLLLFNARQMLGASPGMMAQALVFLCAASLVFRPAGKQREPARERQLMIAWAIGLVASAAIATLASGALLGVLPPLGGVAGAALARGQLRDGEPAERRAAAALVLLVVTGVALRIAFLVAADADVYDPWLGGAPRGGSPPSFELAIEQVFHAFAPWSAILPLAIGHALLLSEKAAPRASEDGYRDDGKDDEPEHGDPEEGSLRLAAVLWAALGFTAQTVYLSRFGSTTYLPVVALAIVVALFLRDVERAGGRAWGAGLVALLLAVLAFRDFRGYPLTPADGLGITDLSAPETFNPTGGWAILLVLFGLCAFLGLSATSADHERFVDDVTLAGRAEMAKLPLGARVSRGVLMLGWPGELLRAQWARGPGYRAWLIFFAVLVCGFVVFGAISAGLLVGDADERPYDTLRMIAIVAWSIAGASWLARIGVWASERTAASHFVTRSLVLTITLALGLAVRTAAGVTRPGAGDAEQERLARALGWIVGAGTLATSTGIACSVLASPGVSSIALRVGVVLLAIVPGIGVGIALVRLVRGFFGWLAHAFDLALLPMLLLGLAVGGYAALRYQPLLSSYFSPREVYDTYNRLAAEGEPLGEYRVGGRAAAYYAQGEVQELDEQADAIRFLTEGEGRRWLAFRADDLAQLNRAYRQVAGRHLFIADARSERILLASSAPIEGMESGNYLAETVLDAVPEGIQHHVGASFDRRIELVGYDLELPNGRSVGPGQEFTVTWYWRALAPVGGSYQIFLHIDGAGQRLNGDHEPVDGRYPVRLWEEGDVVVDRQTLRVPPNYPPGVYTFFIGFFAGEQRLEIVEGPEDDANRARAGTLLVR